MLQWAITFLIIAIFAAILGFGGISAISVSMARGAFLIFVVLFLITTVIHLAKGKTPPMP